MLAVIFSFVPALVENLGTTGWFMTPIPILGATAIYLLEIMVAFLQAFIFTFLTGLFLAQLNIHDHDHDEDHGHEGAVEAAH